MVEKDLKFEEKNDFNLDEYIESLTLKELAYKCIESIKLQIKDKSDYLDGVILNEKYVKEFIDDKILHRFMVARENNLNKAFDMWNVWFKWRNTYHPDKISYDEIKSELETGKAYIHGEDKEGRPCIIIYPAKHFPSQTSFEDSMKYMVYMLEKITKISDEKGIEKIVAIVDRSNVGLSNIDYKMLGQSGIIQMLQDFYAERLHAVYVLHVNWIFRMVFKLISPFMNEKTTSKLKILSSVDELGNYFTKENLLIAHNGTSEYVYKPPTS